MNHYCVMVTRPNPAGAELCKRISGEGGFAIHCPTIAIYPSDNATLREQLSALDQQDWVIFVSPQAVYHSLIAIREAWPHFPSHVKLATLGPGTAHVLQEAGYKVTAFPSIECHSEGVLRLPEFQRLTDKKIAIIRGQGGRELLANTLAARGAKVNQVIVYQRGLPKIDIAEYLALLKQDKIDAVVCASFTAVEHLKKLLGEESWPYIKRIPIIVVSERIKLLAHDLGFQTVWIAQTASHADVLNTIRGMAQQKLKRDGYGCLAKE